MSYTTDLIEKEIKNNKKLLESETFELNRIIYKNEIKELTKSLLILNGVSRQLKGLFLKNDKVTYCGYNVIISEICSKKWCIITDENNHHYNARIKDLRPRTF